MVTKLRIRDHIGYLNESCAKQDANKLQNGSPSFPETQAWCRQADKIALSIALFGVIAVSHLSLPPCTERGHPNNIR